MSKLRIVMMGTGTFAEPTFEALMTHAPGEVIGLVTQPDRDVGRRTGSSRQTGTGMDILARTHWLPVVQPESINSDEALAELAALAPDLLVVAAYGQILKPSVLAIPRLGAINVHASLLPKYRGAAPVAHAILNGETETGVTIIRITPGLDAGEMLAKETLAIEPQETTGDLEARLAILGAKLCMLVVERMKLGPVSGEVQDASLVTKAPKITKEMGHIDWHQPAAVVLNHIRAMQPWPTSYTFFHRNNKEPQRIICLAAARSHRSGARLPGEIETAPGEPISVATADGMITIQNLQIAGKKAMTAAEFIRGYPITAGSHFGPERLS